MNNEMIDKAFEKWFRDRFGISAVAMAGEALAFKAGFELLYPIILKQKECIEFYGLYSNWGGDNKNGDQIDLSDCEFIEKWWENIGGKLARSTIQETDKMMNEIKGEV